MVRVAANRSHTAAVTSSHSILLHDGQQGSAWQVGGCALAVWVGVGLLVLLAGGRVLTVWVAGNRPVAVQARLGHRGCLLLAHTCYHAITHTFPMFFGIYFPPY